MKLKAFNLTLLILISSFCFSTNYYFSSTGSDLNTGTSINAPFNALEKIQTLNLLPGDSILLKKGDVFIGQITIKTSGIAQKPIVISSYGPGTAIPILTGATSIRTWANYPQDTRLFYTSLLQPIKQLYSNNKLLDLARYPNAPSYLKANTGMTVGNVQQSSPTTLKQANGYWVGATVKYRANNWAWEYRPITGFTNGNITYKPDTRYAVAGGNNFFIENKREQLDAPNEWFYDSTTKQLFYYPTNAATIQSSNVKAVIYDNGVKIDSLVSYITISNLIFDKFAANGIYGVAKNSFITIENCAFQNIEEIGVKFYSKANNCFVNNCKLKDVRGRGISFVEAYRNTISNNILKRIGLLQGRGISGVNGYVGIVCEIRDESRDRLLDRYDTISNHNYVHHNIIDSSGYIGIRVDGQYNTVEKNIIDHAMLNLDDGGGLYCYNTVTKSSTINNNFVMNSAAQATITNGIYIDNNAYDMSVLNNTVTNIPGAGILINAQAHDNIIRSNVLYNNSLGVCFSDWGTNPISGNKMYQNSIILNNASAPAIQINSNSGRYNVVVADSNYYVNPYSEEIFKYLWNQYSIFNLAVWRTKIPYNDLNAIALTNKSTPKATAGTFPLFTNKTDQPRTVDLTGCGCTDLKSTVVSQLVLPPFSSQVLIKDPAKCTGLVVDPAYTIPAINWPTENYDTNIFADNIVLSNSINHTNYKTNEELVVYPNPAVSGSLVKIILPKNSNQVFEIKLINSDGQTLIDEISKKSDTFRLPILSKGVYFLVVKDNHALFGTKLMIN